MNRIYHLNAKWYDNTIRSAAGILILTNNPSEISVRNILLSLPEDKSKEFSNFMYQKILDIIKTNHPSKYVKMIFAVGRSIQ